MSVRRTITYVTIAAGILVAAVGLWLAGQTSSLHSAEIWLSAGVAMMAGGGIYSLAMDDAEARAKALGIGHREGDGRQIDLRARSTKPTEVDTGVTV